MNQSSVTTLRKKYYEGDASLEEEKRLVALLLADDAPDEWKEEGRILLLLSNPPACVPPEGFERRLLERLHREPGWADGNEKRTLPNVSLRRWSWGLGIAASLAAVAFFLTVPSKPQPSVYQDTCLNVAEAEFATEDALNLVARILVPTEFVDELGGPCD